MGRPGEPVVCPRCGAPHPAAERFCRDCGLPLIHPGATEADAVVGAAQARARKIKPQLAEGDLVKVAGGRNQAEAEFIQGLLLEEGVPSVLRRSRGFDVPDLLAAGPRDVLVARSGLDTAREVLLQADLAPHDVPGVPRDGVDRQRGSPQSKPVGASHEDTADEG
jgi:ribosomal protein L40E